MKRIQLKKHFHMLFPADIFVSTELSVFVKFLRKTSMIALFVLYLVFRVKKSIFAIFFFLFSRNNGIIV